MTPSRELREIVILIYPGFQTLDLTGPLEVFTAAQRLLEHRRSVALRGPRGGGDPKTEVARPDPVIAMPEYRMSTVSLDGGPVASSSGLEVSTQPAASAPERIDTLIVTGGPEWSRVGSDRRVSDWIAARALSSRRVASVCTGAFLLAAAGLLDGRRATTHWAAASELARLYPAVEVDPHPIFLRDGPVWSSAGVTAGIDLALAMVEEDIDRDLALTIARHLVMFLRRPGNQAQFSVTLASQAPRSRSLREIQRYAIEHLDDDLSVESLAERAHMSPRHFARRFRDQAGVTPGRYVESLRLEAARRMLEESDDPVASVAVRCGFGTAETMRRTFLRAIDVGPAEYRRRFRSHPPTAELYSVA